jgi:hypothetical protein
LNEHVRAIAILFEHPVDRPQVPFNAGHAVEDGAALMAMTQTYPPSGDHTV